ncbi:MAG: hypothetical protein U0Q16_30600 [Bryobacteraceae bacterium]
MSTDLKSNTNRDNAQHSTGPRTAEGKAVSSKNATTHGLFTATFAVAPEHQIEFEFFLELQRDELQPQGVNEEVIFANLVQAAWKTEVTRRLEAEALLEQNEANLDKYSRYATRFERAYYRALNELRKLQTERALRQSEAAAAPNEAPPLADIAKLKKQTQTATQLALDADIRRIAAEAAWTNAQIKAIRLGLQPMPEPRWQTNASSADALS